MRYPYRCQKCRLRVVLPRKKEDYIRTPKCKGCGAAIYFEKARYRYRKNRTLCYCNALDFGESGHRPGSSIWCHRHPTGPTEQDREDRYGGMYDENAPARGVDDPPF